MYLFQARYLHNDIFLDISRYHKVLSHGYIAQPATRVVIATGPGYKFL